MGVHYSLIPWNQIEDEITNNCHPLLLREGDRCRNPNCDCFANEHVEEFWGYCCKQCAVRLREEQYGIVHENPKPFPTERHGPYCQGKKPVNINEIVTPSGEGDGVDRKAIPTTTPMYPSWPPPRFTDAEVDRLFGIQKTTWMNLEQAFNVLGSEHKDGPKGQPPCPINYKSPPPRKTTFIGPLIDVEARKKYAEVISAHLLRQAPDPTLMNFLDQLSEVEQAKFIEEARRIEEEQILVATVFNRQVNSGAGEPQNRESEYQKGLCPPDRLKSVDDYWEQQVYPPVLGAPGHNLIYRLGRLDEETFREFIWKSSMGEGKNNLENHIELNTPSNWIKRLLDQKKVTMECMNWRTPRGDRVEDLIKQVDEIIKQNIRRADPMMEEQNQQLLKLLMR